MPTMPVGSPDPSPTAPWISGDAVAADPRLDDAQLPPEITHDMCAEAATEYLYKRSGRRFRFHNTVIRPLRRGCGCSQECWADTEIELPGPVVASSLVVTIDGVVLDSSRYELYDGHTLVRTDGGTWPICSHQGTPIGTDWSIAFTYGQQVEMDGIVACRELAVHVAMALSGKPSKIPARATSVSRGGVSINLLRGRDRTGIPLVDDFLDAVNPYRLTGRGSVVSPDTIRLSRT